MPNTDSDVQRVQSSKVFPSKQILTYMAIQVGLGALLSIPNLENIQWLKDLLIPLESTFATFRTAFMHSSAPVASKLLLAVWWLMILPWGLMFSYQWSQGFKPHPNGLKMSYPNLLGLLAATLFMGYMLCSLLSIHDYSYYWATDKLNSPSRGDLVPALMSNGPLMLSIWLSLSSFLVVPCVSATVLFPRTLFQKLSANINP